MNPRQQFEQYIRCTYPNDSLMTWGGKYVFPKVQAMWECWAESRRTIAPSMWVGNDEKSALTVDDLALHHRHGDIFSATPWLRLGPAQKFVANYSEKGITGVPLSGKL